MNAEHDKPAIADPATAARQQQLGRVIDIVLAADLHADIQVVLMQADINEAAVDETVAHAWAVAALCEFFHQVDFAAWYVADHTPLDIERRELGSLCNRRGLAAELEAVQAGTGCH